MYRIDSGSSDSFVIRISALKENEDTIALQQAVLESVSLHAPELPVPRPISSISGQNVEYLVKDGSRHAVRVFTYLPGVPVGTTPHTSAQRKALGRTLAQLDQALARVEYPSEGNAFLWDLQRAPTLRPLIAFHKRVELQRLCTSVLDDFTLEYQPRLRHVRRQFIHNDFNPKNVLVDPASPETVTGIIDFGDMVRSALVADVAVTVARQVNPGDPIQEAAEIVSAYHQILPLDDDEIDLVHGLACTRLFMRLTIWTWRVALDDPRSKGTNLEEAAELLGAFRTAGSKRVGTALRNACGLKNKRE
jgi:Ser/Thr protein kinase RdoA (MazF antagonist)